MATETNIQNDKRQLRGRKAKALLAGGLVLGVGAAITLAAWTDNEWVSNIFTAGQFNVQGSTNGTDYADHASEASAAELSFAGDFDSLEPEETVYAGFWVRLAAGTTSPATLVLSDFDGSGTAAAEIDYAIYAIAAGATCDATTATGTAIASGTLSDTTGTSTSVSLAAPVSPDPGVAQQLCFAVTSSADLAQNTTATGTWHFTATSS